MRDALTSFFRRCRRVHDDVCLRELAFFRWWRELDGAVRIMFVLTVVQVCLCLLYIIGLLSL